MIVTPSLSSGCFEASIQSHDAPCRDNWLSDEVMAEENRILVK